MSTNNIVTQEGVILEGGDLLKYPGESKLEKFSIASCIVGSLIIIASFVALLFGGDFHMNHLVTALKSSKDMLYTSIVGAVVSVSGVILNHNERKKRLAKGRGVYIGGNFLQVPYDNRDGKKIQRNPGFF